jgi:hypothetical protein
LWEPGLYSIMMSDFCRGDNVNVQYLWKALLLSRTLWMHM